MVTSLRVRGVPFAGEALYCAGPVTRTRQVASVTRLMTVSLSLAGLTSADGGSNSTLARSLDRPPVDVLGDGVSHSDERWSGCCRDDHTDHANEFNAITVYTDSIETFRSTLTLQWDLLVGVLM